MKAAIAMQKALAEHNKEREKRGQPPLRQGIGLHTGPLIFGTVGGLERTDCGAIGETSIIASRVEGMTERYGAAVLITRQTYMQLTPNSVDMRELGAACGPGMKSPVELFEVLNADDDEVFAAKLGARHRFNGAREAFFARHFDHALHEFRELAGEHKTDEVYQVFAARAEAMVGIETNDANADDHRVDHIDEK